VCRQQPQAAKACTPLPPFTVHGAVPAPKRKNSNSATPCSYSTILLPSLLLSKRYFAGEIRFGDISQASFAFRM
jgi:hypothetical protein